MHDFLFFWGDNRKRLGDRAVFSQFYPAAFHSDGLMFPSAEHWMMYQKAMLFDDTKIASKILNTEFAGKAKEYGRCVADFDQKVWDEEKIGIVRLGNLLKFTQNGELEQILVDTGDRILVEASPYDPIWGIGLRETDFGATNPLRWNGDNLLGFILMDVRRILTSTTKTQLEDWT